MATTEQDREDDFPDTPQGWAERWTVEMNAAKEWMGKSRSRGEKVLKRFRGEAKTDGAAKTLWNLFSANVQTQRAMVYGQIPKVDVSRKFGDADDDAARLAGEIIKRMLDGDITRPTDRYAQSIGLALDDFQLPGLGGIRWRYVAKFEKRSVEAKTADDGAVLAEGYEEEAKASEDVECLHVHWKDVRWNQARTPEEVRFFAFKAEMSRKEMRERFGELAQRVPLNSKPGGDGTKRPWDRADVWEIWSKEHGRVFWWVEGFDRVLDDKPDPLGLLDFWPLPLPMLANTTSDDWLPLPDFVLAQDLYNEVDELSTRIRALQRALRVRGLYDQSFGDLQRLFSETDEAQLIPVPNWAMFADKGGFKGSIAFFPILEVAQTLDKLREQRTETVAALYQITGMSDIMRGQATEAGTTATEQKIKGRFASVRMQALQDRFAKFCSEGLRIKAEIIAKHFDAETIIERSNARYLPDAQVPGQLEAAIQLIKSDVSQFRIEVKPEAVALADFASMKSERVELVGALSQLFTALAPLTQQMPGAATFGLELAKWTVAATRGASTIEAVLDQAIQQAKQAAAQPQPQQPPDPKLQIAAMKQQSDQAKAALDLKKEQMKLQGDLVRLQAETQAKAEQERNQAMSNIAEARAKSAITRSGAPPAFNPGGGGAA